MFMMDIPEVDCIGESGLSSNDAGIHNAAVAASDDSDFVAKNEESQGVLSSSDANESFSSQLESSQAEENIDDAESRDTAEETESGKRRNDGTDDNSESSERSKNTSQKKQPSCKVVSEYDEDAAESENCDKEAEEDDLTSKLLSIQELPRIPKRKQLEGKDDGAASVDKSSYRSVLERVETGSSRGMGSFPNWSTSGWKRSSADSVAEDKSTWSNKSSRAERTKRPDWTKISRASEFHGPRSSLNKGYDKIRSLKDTKDSVTSASTGSVQSVEYNDSTSNTSVEKTAVSVSVPGPLPTLPFEEQMRERAKLRSLQMANRVEKPCVVDINDDTNNSSQSTDLCGNSKQTANAEMNITCNQENKRVSITSQVESHKAHCSGDWHSEKANGSEVVWNGSQSGHKRTDSSEKCSMPYNRLDTKSRRSNRNGEKKISSKSASYNTHSTSPLPHLPVLPLFAAVCSTDNAAADSALPKQSVNLTVAVKESSSANTVDSQSASHVKAGASGSKTVTFSCPEGSDKLTERKGKAKKTSDKKQTKVSEISHAVDHSVIFVFTFIIC